MPAERPSPPDGRLLPVHDTHLYVVERGPADALPVLVLRGDDDAALGEHLGPLDARYRLVVIDARAQGRSDRNSDPHSWTLSQHASDVSAVAAAIGVERYAVLGHGPGAAVALQHATDAPGAAVATVVSSGVPSMLDGVEKELPHVVQPLLACVGRHDRSCPPEASARIAELAPRGELYVFESAGHTPFVEAPEEFLQVVGDFLDRATA